MGGNSNEGKVCSTGSARAADCRAAAAGLRQLRYCHTAQDGPAYGKGALQSPFPEVRNHRRNQTGKAGDSFISEGAMFGEERYGSRVPSEREQRVIELVAQGLKNREVADAIGTTEHVVKNYLRNIYDKLGLWNRVELALWYEARRHESLVHA